MNSPLAARLLVVLAAVLWSAGSFMKVFNHPTSLGLHEPELKPVPIAFWRGLFAGLALLPLVRFRYVRFTSLMPGMVACFAVMSGLYLSALGLGPAANAILLQNSAPVWVYLIGVYLLKQKADGRAAVSAVLALGGVGVIVGGNWPWGVSGGEQTAQVVILLMGAGSGLTYAGVVLFLSQLRAHSPAFLMVLNLLGSAAVLGVYLWLTGGFVLPTPLQLSYLALFGVVQLAVPYWLFARGLRTLTAQEAGIITLLEPVLNPVWAYLIAPDTEVPTGWTLAGGAVLLAALSWKYLPNRNRANSTSG
ncbi:MAG: DMT family transporter [Fimbriiglobus sp.]|nr:DMT family transporter [Fimbriiglobus sp.]